MKSLTGKFRIAAGHHQAGNLHQAEVLYMDILSQEPNHVDVLHLLGVLAHQTGRSDIGVEYIRRAIVLHPDFPEAFSNLGELHRSLGHLKEAISAFRQAIALKPDYYEAHSNLSNALCENGNPDESITASRMAISFNPEYPEAHLNLGNALREKGYMSEALIAYRTAISLRSDYATAHYNLGVTLYDCAQMDEAVIAYRQAIALKPDYAKAYTNLGTALKDMGRLDEAIHAFRTAAELKPGNTLAHCNLINTLHFHPDHDERSISEEHRHWRRQFEEPLKAHILPHRNDRNRQRKLRIGYVSPDFRKHCQSFFTIPLLSHHDHSFFEIYCYADIPHPDEITARIRSYSNTWRNTTGLSDDDVACLIRNDQIDILVDLTMHMAFNRLTVFARKPAPIQITWLAYPGSTGLQSIDYRLTDPWLDPPEHPTDLYSEKSIQLPDTFWCYDPLDNVPDVTPLPAALNSGSLTFGSLNNYCKVNEGVLLLWSKVLCAVKDSRLLLLSKKGSHRQHALDFFQRCGVASERIEWFTPAPRADYMSAYQRIDIGLDTFPYNGHTTSLDSFWMGVPVVTLVGKTVVGRGGLSQSMNLGLPELIAYTEEQYIHIAKSLSSDLPRLAHLRQSLRQRMQASPLMDAPRFARNIEAAYRIMWHTWCGERESDVKPGLSKTT